MFPFQLGGFPSWSEGLGRGIENHENVDFCGMWPRVSQQADKGQILPWSQVLMFSPCEIGKKNEIYICCHVRYDPATQKCTMARIKIKDFQINNDVAEEVFATGHYSNIIMAVRNAL